MKKRIIIKTAFLVAPFLLALLYFFDGGGNGGIGGGSYDLGYLYYYLFSIPYLIIYEIVIAIMMLYANHRNIKQAENTYLFWVVLVVLVGHIAGFASIM